MLSGRIHVHSGLKFCALITALFCAAAAPIAIAQSSDYQRGYSTGLMEGRACRSGLPGPGVNNSSDFVRGWIAGYSAGHKSCQQPPPANPQPGGGGAKPGGGGGALRLVAASLPAATPGTQYQTRLTATGGTPPYSFNWTSPYDPNTAPKFLSISSDGVISGRPGASEAGTQYTLDIVASDHYGQRTTSRYSLTVAGVQAPGGGAAVPAQPAVGNCDPRLPAYSQPGCHAGGTPAPGGGTAVPVQPAVGNCDPRLPAYSQPGCHAGGQNPSSPSMGAPIGPPAPPLPTTGTVETCDAVNPLFAGHPAAISGIWYFYTGGSSEETWELWGDSMFRHTWISSGAGASTRTSERGRFQLSGTSLTLHITSQSGGFVAGGGMGGGTACKDETRRATLKVLGNQGDGGLVLDGALLKFQSR